MNRLINGTLLILIIGMASLSHAGQVRLSGQQLAETVRKLIEKKWNKSDIDLETSLLQVPNDIVVAQGKLSWKINVNEVIRVSRVASIPVEIFHNKKFFKRVNVSLRVRRFAEVLTVVNSVNRHQFIDEKDFKKKRVELFHDIESYVRSTKDLAHKRSKRRLQPKTVVLKKYMETIPIISKGETISILAKSGPISLAAKGVAKSDGNAGDVISVTNLHTGRPLLARVTVNGQVVISQNQE